MFFAPGILSCLRHGDERQIKSCIYEADLGILRVFFYNYVMMVSCFYKCNPPYIMMMPTHDRVMVSMGRCADTEGAIWEIQKFMEQLPGVWYVRTTQDKDMVRIEAIPYDDLYRW